MPSPITSQDFEIQDFSGDMCERIKKLLEINNTLKTWFAWAFDDNGEAKSAFLATLSSAFLPVGALLPFPKGISQTPSGFLPADGRAVSRATYANLFAVYGVEYGAGDGSTTFNLPDMRDRVFMGASPTYAAGSKGGEANVTLTASQIPPHTHDLPQGYEITAQAATAKLIVDADSTTATLVLATAANTGGGGSHNNLQPYFCGTWLVKY